MAQEELFAVVISALCDLTGADAAQIRGSTRPIGDLGLESIDGIDLACILEERGLSLPLDWNPLKDDERKRARTVDQMVDLLSEYAAQTSPEE